MLLGVVIVQQPLKKCFCAETVMERPTEREREREEKCRNEACVVGVKCLETSGS